MSAAQLAHSLVGSSTAPMSDPLVEAVEALYGEHYAPLYRYLLRLGCNETEADDTLQEAFLRLFRELKKGTRIERPKYWLLRVARNIQIDAGRSNWREEALDESEHESGARAMVSSTPSAEAEIIDREWTESVRVAVKQLPPRQYDYLLLRAEGLTLKEIAELKGVTIQTVSEALARAIDRIWRATHD